MISFLCLIGFSNCGEKGLKNQSSSLVNKDVLLELEKNLQPLFENKNPNTPHGTQIQEVEEALQTYKALVNSRKENELLIPADSCPNCAEPEKNRSYHFKMLSIVKTNFDSAVKNCQKQEDPDACLIQPLESLRDNLLFFKGQIVIKNSQE